MMEKFRNLSNNIFFKIFLGFLGLTFVMFGISGFILGNKGSWVAKVGGKTISYDTFVSTLQNDREAIYRSNQSPEVRKYLESSQFKQDVLGRMITRNLVQSLQSEFQIYPNRDLILAEILSNDSLKDKDGKFNRVLYQNFLKSNNLTEKQHISDLADEIVGGIIVQSFADVPTTNANLAKDLFAHRFQTRNADLITVSTKNIGNIANPNEFELNAFFEKNKDKFALPEMRKVSFVKFGAQDLKQKITVSDEEIAQDYQTNKSDYQLPESRDFYHILLSDEAEAKEFAKSLKESADNNQADIFAKLAAAKGKDKSAILLTKIVKKDLPKEIADDVFVVSKNKSSDVLKSQLGFHIFYLVDSHPASEIPFDKVKNQIRAKVTAAKEEGQIQNQMQAIADEVLATGSLDKVATKFGFVVNKNLPKFNSQGLDSKQNPVANVTNLDDFLKNSFALEQGRVSKVFASKSNEQYYIISIDDVKQGRQRSLDEVKVLASDMWVKNKKQQKLQELANDVVSKINANAVNSNVVAAQYGLKVIAKNQLPRFYMLDADNGKKVPYADQLLKDIFSANLNQATKPHQASADEMVIAVVKKIQSPAQNDAAVKMIAKEAQNSFRTDILTVFNQYVQKQFPVEVNQKLMQTSEQTENE
jgi:peptidyl-prolyl cis-trans isomerase D